ncbi:transporter associated domain-containing protein, partial [Streptomyces sp. L7]
MTLEDIWRNRRRHRRHGCVPSRGVRPQGDGSVNVDGRVPIRDLNRAMDWNLPDESTTIAGLVIHEARTIPDGAPPSTSTASASTGPPEGQEPDHDAADPAADPDGPFERARRRTAAQRPLRRLTERARRAGQAIRIRPPASGP